MKRLLAFSFAIIYLAFKIVALDTLPHDDCYFDVEEGDVYIYDVIDLETGEEMTATATVGAEMLIPYSSDTSSDHKMTAHPISVEFSNGTNSTFYVKQAEIDEIWENMIITSDNVRVYNGTFKYFSGDMVKILSTTKDHLISEVDYVYLGGRLRRRARLTAEDDPEEIIHIQGLGLNRFVTNPDIFGKKREYKIVSISDRYGNEISADDFDVANVVSQPTKFIDGTVVKYSFSYLEWYFPLQNFSPSFEYRIMEDYCYDNIEGKRMERWIPGRTNEWEKSNDGMFFQYDDVVYQTYFDGLGCIIYMRFDVVPGDCVLAGSTQHDPGRGVVSEISETEILGETLRTIRFTLADESPYEYHAYWIEGVGPNCTGLDSDTFDFWIGTQSLDGLYKDGECVFKYSDFYNATFVKDISETQIHETNGDNGPVYNLQGIRIDNPTTGQICIRNGRKVLYR